MLECMILVMVLKITECLTISIAPFVRIPSRSLLLSSKSPAVDPRTIGHLLSSHAFAPYAILFSLPPEGLRAL